MTAKRKPFWGVTISIFGIDFALHFYRELQQIHEQAHELHEGLFQFFMNTNALFVLAWNTFARTAETIESPIGIIILAGLVWWYFDTKPEKPPKI